MVQTFLQKTNGLLRPCIERQRMDILKQSKSSCCVEAIQTAGTAGATLPCIGQRSVVALKQLLYLLNMGLISPPLTNGSLRHCIEVPAKAMSTLYEPYCYMIAKYMQLIVWDTHHSTELQNVATRTPVDC